MRLSDDRVKTLLREAAEPTEREAQHLVESPRRPRAAFAALAATAIVVIVVGVVVTLAIHDSRSPGGTDRLRVTDSTSPSPSASAAVPTLTGRRWVLVTPSPTAKTAYVVFSADGTWYGSDGCNSFGGTYRYDPSGAFSGVLSGSTLAYCDVPHVGDWIMHAKHAEISGNQLRLTAADGQLLGVLTAP